MNRRAFPKKQGLYNPVYEKDACGIGMIANIDNIATHQIVEQGLTMLARMEHRGGFGSDPATGDGAGLMIQIPHRFFQMIAQEGGWELPDLGRYAVGMVFLPKEDDARENLEQELEKLVSEKGFHVIGWREVGVDQGKLSQTAINSQPVIKQVFIGTHKEIESGLPFERELYVIRRQWEHVMKEEGYVVSFSSRTIVYKGLLTPVQLREFYLDLQNSIFTSAFAIVHSRFSTNTFPSWERAHPNRYLIHNGEINTLRANVNAMMAREQSFVTSHFGEDLSKVLPVIDIRGSDSSMLDNCFEFLTLAGRSIEHVAMMMVPEPWEQDEEMNQNKKAFYQYHSARMEPWDGPMAIVFTDGCKIGAVLDRNGLRPARYYVTTENQIVLSSEVGVVDLPDHLVIRKGRLSPGKMLLVDLEEQRILSDEKVKEQVASACPYVSWNENQIVTISDLVSIDEDQKEEESLVQDRVFLLQQVFGYNQEELGKQLVPMVTEAKDPIGSMGIDSPLAVLSDRPQLLSNYFKQSFAQVTNPPIDAIREQCVTSTHIWLGAEGNLLDPHENQVRRICLDSPLLSKKVWKILTEQTFPEFKTKTLPIVFSASGGETELEKALERLCRQSEEAIAEGAKLLLLNDSSVNQQWCPIPVLLAVSALHQHLVRKGIRRQVSLLVYTGEARDVHQLSLLLSYGADAIHPYLAIRSLVDQGEEAEKSYLQSALDGIVKVMSKIGISTIQSYQGGQTFEAIGIHTEVMDRYFTGTPSTISGITLEVIAKEALYRHQIAFEKNDEGKQLDPGGDFQYRRGGEYHAFQPKTVHALQKACRNNDENSYREYARLASEERFAMVRDLFTWKSDCQPIPIEEVESVESIVKRFKTGAMSYGSLSQEAHETLAIAMNRIGGKSNSGEGGEDPQRYTVDSNGNLRRSAIKQVASGRFGVSSHYLVNADEIQIKIAQGAKPGEGGQLPGNKVVPWIAEVRGSTPGVGLISPPPHHDIYSIEDLAQLIHDLKNANPQAKVSVKLVAKSGVGTIAAGVAKALADGIVISGHDGGTGASPRTSIKHAGIPWELGLAETHQTLMLNGLRDRVTLETDGKMMTGRDVIMATLLGAEEYAFATAPLVSIGCVMARVCHLDTCPVGIATQNLKLRNRFKGDPEHVVRFMKFVAQEVRELLASLGYRYLHELVGRSDLLQKSERANQHWKARYLDLEPLRYVVESSESRSICLREQNHKLDESLDFKQLLSICKPAYEQKTPVTYSLPITNTNRVFGTLLGSEITRHHGQLGLPTDTIQLHVQGSAGQSFGAWIPKGLSIYLQGDANDYVGKGLSGGLISVKPSRNAIFAPDENVIVGNVVLYGATSGEMYIRGQAGERFAVRNSGADAVVEGIGDHGCEYMTGGHVVILGEVGKNFAAGMSGGIAYVLTDTRDVFETKCNHEMVEIQSIQQEEDAQRIQHLLRQHVRYTHSKRAQMILDYWDFYAPLFIKVISTEYKNALLAHDVTTHSEDTMSMSKNETSIPNDSKKKIS